MMDRGERKKRRERERVRSKWRGEKCEVPDSQYRDRRIVDTR
jgi:hypothetical protein